jgi:uncharacterized membrane protein
MLDNLRDQTSFQPDEDPSASDSFDKPVKRRRRRRTIDQVTGMTGLQRFILSAMVFTIILLLGVLLMVVTGKFILPW